MRIAVTGAAGFVGSQIVRTLVVEGHTVDAIDDLSKGKVAHLEGVACNWHKCDAAIFDGYDSADAIVHAAAYPDVSANWKSLGERFEQLNRNAILTMKILERFSASGPPRRPFVLVSTCSVYGEGGIVDETSPTRSTSPYAATKLASEKFVEAFTEGERVRGIILRLCNVVGPRYGHGHLADFVRMARETGKVHALDDGYKWKSFVHVADVAEAVSKGIELVRHRWNEAHYYIGADHERPRVLASRRVFNVASDTRWSWRDSIAVMRAMRPDRPFELTNRSAPGGWVGDPPSLEVRTRHDLFLPRRSIVDGVRESLESLGWMLVPGHSIFETVAAARAAT